MTRRALVFGLCFWAGATLGVAVAHYPALALAAWWTAKTALLGVGYASSAGQRRAIR